MFTVIISGDFVNTDEAQNILESEFGAEYDEDTVAFIDVDTRAEAEALVERLNERLIPLAGDQGVQIEFEDADGEDWEDEEEYDEDEVDDEDDDF